jgi:hypothetical protein
MPMARLIAKLLLIVAMLSMPFGMTAAAGSAHHDAMAMGDTSMRHCPDQGSGHNMKGGIAECTMACAAALPAADATNGGPPLIICDPVLPGTAQRLHSLHPDIATPPPKRS